MIRENSRALLQVLTVAIGAATPLSLVYGETAFEQARQAAGIEFVAPTAVRPAAVPASTADLSADPRVIEVKIFDVPTTTTTVTPRGKILFAQVTAAVCRRGFPTVNPKVSKLSSDTALLELSVESTCSNQRAIFALPLEGELTGLGFDPATVKIQWNGRIVWPAP